MGGMSYDRDVYNSGNNYSSSGFHSSPLADASFTKSELRDLDRNLLPHKRRLECTTQTGIVIALDVTGSMGDSAKMLYDKLPMLWGQLEQQGYLKGFSISFAAVGDCTCDGAPFQICDFAEGKALDTWIKRMYLEGGGGGQGKESYEMLAYFYANKVDFTHPKAGQEKPFFFLIGDEAPYETLNAASVKQHFGDTSQEDISSSSVFNRIKEKYNFKHIHVPYSATSNTSDSEIQRIWRRLIGDDLLTVDEPKAVVDVILGAIALITKQRTLEQYKEDMQNRSQTADRIRNVSAALHKLADSQDDNKHTEKKNSSRRL